MPGAGEQLSPEQLLRTLERGKQPDTLGSKINQALQLITTILDDLGYASTRTSGVPNTDQNSEHQVAISFNGGKDCKSAFTSTAHQAELQVPFSYTS